MLIVITAKIKKFLIHCLKVTRIS